MAMEQVYLWVGLLSLGLADLYLYRYPIFHPLVWVPVVGWVFGDLSAGLVVGGMLELIFGLAYFRGIRKLNLILYAGGLAVFINQATHNINLVLSLTIALLLAFAFDSLLRKLKDWQKGLSLLVISGILIFLIPLGGDAYGHIPAQFLNQVAVSGGVLPWIFFAYAILGLFHRTENREIIMAIPAILMGSVLSLEIYFWGPLVFLVIYYGLFFFLKDREITSVSWVDVAVLILGMYVLMPSIDVTTLGVFIGILLLNILLAARNFAPIEIYLLIFIAGIILSRGELLF